MNVTRYFILAGGLFLLLGIVLGMHMAASGNHATAPVHAHINLLGFTLMTVFGLVYKLFPTMAEGRLAVVHFWLHLVGSLALLVMLFMLTTGRITEAGMVPVAPIAEVLVLLGTLVFLWNAFRNVR